MNVQAANRLKSRESFKLSKSVAIYDAVRMMATAWNLVPTKVVINGWLSCKILAPYREGELRVALLSVTDFVKSSKLPHRGTPLKIQNTLAEHRSREAKRQGADYLESIENTTVQSEADCTIHSVTQTEWLHEVMEHLEEDLRGLRDCSVIDSLDVSELSVFINEEEEEDTSYPIEGNSIQDVVSCVLGSDTSAEGAEDEDADVIEASLKVSVGRLQASARAVICETEMLLAESHPAIITTRPQEILQLLRLERAQIGL